MSDPVQLRQAWDAVKRSRTEIAARDTNGHRAVPTILLQAMERQTNRRGGHRTGFTPERAAASLSEQGVERSTAEQLVSQAVLARFPAFANSWDNYIENKGYLLDLLLLSEDEKTKLANQPALGRLRELVERTASSPATVLSDSGLALELARLGELNARRDEQHPAYALMVHVHGLHPELARAVMLHAKVVPWWVYAVLVFFILISGATFLLAVFNPASEVFQNEEVGGVNLLHYTVLPLFTLGFAAALWWLLKNRRRFEGAWREQLGRYARAMDAEGS